MSRNNPTSPPFRSDTRKSKSELIYELHSLRLEHLRLRERVEQDCRHDVHEWELKYLESTGYIDQTIRRTTNLEDMMNSLMEALRSIFQCDQAWLLHPCDPHAPSWKVPFRSVHPDYPIPFAPEDDLPSSPDLIENCRLTLKSDEAVPLGEGNAVKDFPTEAREVDAKAALLISLHPKVGRPWMMGLHHCSEQRTWTPQEKQLFKDISGRISDALSSTLFYRNLEQNQERLKHLSTQLFRAQEEERKRVAQEIHDELGQAALAIKVGVDNALILLDDQPESISRPLQSASNLSKAIVQKMRRMQRSLYPPTLRDFGAITALNGFLDDFANIYSMDVRKSVHIIEEDIPDSLRVTVFRLAQEALYNVGKHSKAETVTVVLDAFGSRLFLEIIDDGVGFDPVAVLCYPDKRLGLGLTSMKERAEMGGGSMEIDSTPGSGTTIHFVWPLDEM